jgi:glyoxylase-like metal-dependent hydrolase (beta-lactamase superfamily II)
MKIHAVQTGSVRIKRAQAVGRGYGMRRQMAIFFDHEWTDWLPTFAWVIEHPEGIIVVDTGQGTHLLDSTKLLHPYLRWEVAFRIEREQEIGPQLRGLGIRPRDVRQVILTHLHVDHDGGLAHFMDIEIHVPRGEIRMASGWLGMMRGYLPNRWPSWFEPVPLDLEAQSFGPFRASKRLTTAGDVVVVGTHGHTANHVSVLVQDGETTAFLAGDTSYDDGLHLDGVSPNDRQSLATLEAIRHLARSDPTIYLPTHDPLSATRLSDRRTL